jgi:hypothetical protein
VQACVQQQEQQGRKRSSSSKDCHRRGCACSSSGSGSGSSLLSRQRHRPVHHYSSSTIYPLAATLTAAPGAFTCDSRVQDFNPFTGCKTAAQPVASLCAATDY